MLPFFILGLWVRKHEKTIISTNYLFLWLLLFVFSMAIWKKEYIWYLSTPQWFPLKDILHSHSLIFDLQNFFNVLIRYFVGTVSSFFFISLFYHLYQAHLFKFFEERISKYGKYSLHVYIIQTFLVEINVFGINFPSDSKYFSIIYCLLMSVAVLIISIVLAMALEKNKYINKYLFGKS